MGEEQKWSISVGVNPDKDDHSLSYFCTWFSRSKLINVKDFYGIEIEELLHFV